MRDARMAELDGEASSVGAPREDLAREVGEDLLALYEKIRASSGGTGAAALRQRRCGGTCSHPCAENRGSAVAGDAGAIGRLAALV